VRFQVILVGSIEMLHCAVSKELTDVSEVLNAFIIITLVMQTVSTSEMSVVKYSKDKCLLVCGIYLYRLLFPILVCEVWVERHHLPRKASLTVVGNSKWKVFCMSLSVT
jgi:hypothetical protein